MGGEYEQPFNEVTDALREILKTLNLEDQSSLVTLADGVKLTITATSFFNSASSELKPEAEQVLVRVGDVLKNQQAKFKIFVEGHTDDLPMKSTHTPSNWELSSDRAAVVVRLFESLGVAHHRLRPVGKADVDPYIEVTELRGEQLRQARARIGESLFAYKKSYRLE